MLYSDIVPAKAAALELNRSFIVRGLAISTVLAAALLAVVWALRNGRMGIGAAAAAVAVLAAGTATRMR